VNSNCSELKLEFDKNQSLVSGVANMSTFYFGLSGLQDDYDDVRFKIFNSSLLTFLSSYTGHEYYGHAYLLRKYNIDHHVHILSRETNSDLTTCNPDTKLNIYINGLKFNSELGRESRKNQVMNNIDYKNSLLLIFQKSIPLFTFRDKSSSSDYTHYCKFNSKNDFEKHVIISMFDPTLWYSVFCVSKLFIYNEELEYKNLPFISIDFEIYPHETSNLFIVARMIDSHYISLSYEKGSQHEGCGFQITNIKFTNYTSLDYKFHYFNGYDHSIIIYYNHLYTRLNYENCDYDISNNIQIGWRF